MTVGAAFSEFDHPLQESFAVSKSPPERRDRFSKWILREPLPWIAQTTCLLELSEAEVVMVPP